jgi:hypothetical protein
MRKKHKHYGFSLTEVLLAVGTLSIGMIFVAGVFPVAIHFSTVASERTIGAVVADEAFAKVRMYGEIDSGWVTSELPPTGCVAFESVLLDGFVPIEPNEFVYPSYDKADILASRYCWSALCRRVGDTGLVQVTVFVSRKAGSTTEYWFRDPAGDTLSGRFDYPVPVPMTVSPGGSPDELVIIDDDPLPGTPENTCINDDYTIVDDQTGRLYRVVERYRASNSTIRLDGDWQGGDRVWVVPPPKSRSRYPCLAVYQKVLMF